MRFNSKPKRLGDSRAVTRFAFFPITIGTETRWLEVCKIRQRREEVENWVGFGVTSEIWVNKYFINETRFDSKGNLIRK